jgi:hypothetical protein
MKYVEELEPDTHFRWSTVIAHQVTADIAQLI